jgi:putative flippase GtrA
MTKPSPNMLRHAFVRFLAIGVLNTVFGFSVYAACLLMHTAVALALAASTILGIAFNFVTTGRYVFQNAEMRQLPAFTICYGVSYGLNLMFLTLLLHAISSKFIAQALLALPMAMISYLLMKTFVFYRGATA